MTRFWNSISIRQEKPASSGLSSLREEIVGFISELQKEQKQSEQEVKLFIQDNELASSEAFRVSWKNIDSIKLDTKRIKEERPELYDDYGKVSHPRRFEVKAA